MHELAVTESLLQVVLRHASDSGAERVVSVNVRLGELSDLVNEWVQRYFDHRCSACGEVFPADPRTREAIRCPLCSSAEMTLASGRECFVHQIEVV
jgi:hydrogenase nickel incorporation protein HypA/HybF